MISVEEGKNLIKNSISTLPSKKVRLDAACGCVLAENIYAMVDVPFYPQSAMDGYAFKFKSLQDHSDLKLIGKMQAGSSENISVEMGEAIRIFTGAPVPQSVDTVVMQEKTMVENDRLIITDENIKLGQNVRAKGSEIKAGDLGLEIGQLITPAGIGFLASIGITEIEVYDKPKVSIIVTGDELQEIGFPLEYGQVYESNSHTVKSALQNLGINDVNVYKVKDSLDELVDILTKSLMNSDIILLTGGVSVGEYDYVNEATIKCGIDKVFHKLKQKPGKPLFFGTKGNKIVFGLPGNPSSVLTCFYQYVLIAIGILSNKNLELSTRQVPFVGEYKKPSGITHFLKGYFDGTQVKALEGQESYKLNSFAKSNCLIEIAEDETIISNLQLVKIHIL